MDLGNPVLEGDPVDLILHLAIPQSAFKSNELALWRVLADPAPESREGEPFALTPAQDIPQTGPGSRLVASHSAQLRQGLDELFVFAASRPLYSYPAVSV